MSSRSKLSVLVRSGRRGERTERRRPECEGVATVCVTGSRAASPVVVHGWRRRELMARPGLEGPNDRPPTGHEGPAMATRLEASATLGSQTGAAWHGGNVASELSPGAHGSLYSREVAALAPRPVPHDGAGGLRDRRALRTGASRSLWRTRTRPRRPRRRRVPRSRCRSPSSPCAGPVRCRSRRS